MKRKTKKKRKKRQKKKKKRKKKREKKKNKCTLYNLLGSQGQLIKSRGEHNA